MKTIHKYQVILGVPTLMPKHALVLSVGIQQHGFLQDDIFIWAQVDTDNELEPQEFMVVATGEDIPESELDFNFIGTVHTDDGLVFHVFMSE